jgi:ssDNA-binding Zn-finger/Zn-ribbon topoisomerase 1
LDRVKPRYIAYYGSAATTHKNHDYPPDEIVCLVDTKSNLPIKICVYTGLRRGSDIILDSIRLKAFFWDFTDQTKKDRLKSIEEIEIKNDAKTHILERLQKNIVKIAKKVEKDIVPCPEEGCDGLIVEKYSEKTQSTFWACNRYPNCKYIDKERSNQNKGVEAGPYDKKCTECGKKMLRRLAKKGPLAGKEFWGCSAYPNCKHTENI